jgi:hypothetical protein
MKDCISLICKQVSIKAKLFRIINLPNFYCHLGNLIFKENKRLFEYIQTKNKRKVNKTQRNNLT